jgi:hypothetical protein
MSVQGKEMNVKKLLVSLGVSLLSTASIVSPAAAQTGPAAAPCQFVLGFRALHDMAPTNVGDCLDDQASAVNGDAQQQTTNGLLVWRKSDNWTAFTNGYMTWLDGPAGLVARLNTQRFPWEGNDGSGATIIPDPSGASQAAGAGAAGATVTPSMGASAPHMVSPAPSGPRPSAPAQMAPRPAGY